MTQDPDVHSERIRLVLYAGGAAMVVSRTDSEALKTVARKRSVVNSAMVMAHFPTKEEVFELSHMGVPTYRHDDKE